ncbi:hypothetical protein HHK36_020153 [Tetracentron sinense]|uniref:BHLH domain-containing protein n=1 Tax=Tetracentron sinense TaxID=13715 RepID=A0A834YYH0_TETSI|nr:hypothetical protein HHK36_020153 [Tetracentron sinense]
MEKELFFLDSGSPQPTWQSSSSGMEIQTGELNCSSEQLPNSFLNLNWDNSMDQSVPFESALSSMVSSPAASNAGGPTDSVVIRELIGRLGSICNSGEISPQCQTLGYNGGNNSTNTSCYSTPLNSPPKLNLSMLTNPNLAPFSADPGFAERAARFSCFGSRSFSGRTSQFGFNETEFPYRCTPRMETGKLSRVSSSQSLKAAGSYMAGQENKDTPFQEVLEADMRSVSASASASASASDRKFSRLSRSSTPEKAEFANVLEESSASRQIPRGEASCLNGPNDVNARKRKAVPRAKAKDLPSSPPKDGKVAAEDDAKRCKPAEATGNEKDDVKAKAEPNGSINTAAQDSPKPSESQKDYIHVRARRGQATDSHSLAERVRREKISERMKFLQDLVPGCNKITGKAVMLDEIINYVQSLQRQVEFLSMKLVTVNPRMETILPKDILQSRESLPHTNYPIDSSASTFPNGHQPQRGPLLQSGFSSGAEIQNSMNHFDAGLCRNQSIQLPPLDGFGEAASQLTTFWEDDLHSVVQMGFPQNQISSNEGSDDGGDDDSDDGDNTAEEKGQGERDHYEGSMAACDDSLSDSTPWDCLALLALRMFGYKDRHGFLQIGVVAGRCRTYSFLTLLIGVAWINPRDCACKPAMGNSL